MDLSNIEWVSIRRDEQDEAENYQYITSLLASWRLQGKNGFEELKGLLRKELCMSSTNTFIFTGSD